MIGKTQANLNYFTFKTTKMIFIELFIVMDCCRNKLHAGIMRDVERQEQRKFENLYVLEQQRELTKKLREREQKELDSQTMSNT